MDVIEWQFAYKKCYNNKFIHLPSRWHKIKKKGSNKLWKRENSHRGKLFPQKD